MRPTQQSADEDLSGFVIRLVGHDELGWREFVDRFAPHMYAYFCRDFRFSPALAEDLTTESLMRITQYISRFEYRSALQFKAWIFAICRNVGIDYTRRAPKECPLPDHLQDVNADGEPQADAEICSAVHDAVSQLSPTARKVVQLHFLEGIGQREIAEQMSTSYGAVRVCLSRALKQLESMLRADDRILRRLRTK